MIPPLTAQFTTSSGRYRLYTPSIFTTSSGRILGVPSVDSMSAPAYPAILREYVIKVQESK